ncbi:MAG TPA: hypothetical protein VLV15_10515 [Dongiaceae bacterium]|nr:hypothetical protein [Dongiaceae bacterium]
MTRTLTLAAHSLRRARWLIVGVGCLLGGFQILATLLAGTFQASNLFGSIAGLVPGYVRDVFGSSMLAVLSFQGIVCLGFLHPVAIGGLLAVVIVLATEPAAEVERRFVDLVLARPVARHTVVTRTIVVTLAAAAALLGLMTLGTWLGLLWFAPAGAPWPPASQIAALVAGLGALAVCWSGIALAIAARARRRSVAGSVVGLLALATFLLDYVARVWAPARPVARLSPFRYYNPTEVLLGRALNPAHLWVLAAVGLLGFGIAYLVFGRRDV